MTRLKLPVEDRLALQDLIADYSWALDTGDVDALVACFTPDAVMTEEVFEDPDIWEGHDGIRGIAEHYRNAPGFPGRQHHVTQIQYTPQADGSVSDAICHMEDVDKATIDLEAVLRRVEG